MLGFIDDRELSKWYVAADIFVLPAIVDENNDTEGLGMVLVEAMMNGTPVVGSSVGGIVDIVKHEISGLHSAPGDPKSLAEQIMRLLDEPKLYARLKKDGKGFAQNHFSWDTITNRLLEVYAKK